MGEVKRTNRGRSREEIERQYGSFWPAGVPRPTWPPLAPQADEPKPAVTYTMTLTTNTSGR
jgi:hypothetical protein